MQGFFIIPRGYMDEVPFKECEPYCQRMNHNTQYIPIIQNLGLMNQYLLSKSIDYGLSEEVRQLQKIDQHLSSLLYCKANGFDFIAEICSGTVLLVGEGNLTFTHSLTRKRRITSPKLTATTFENSNELLPSVFNRAIKLKALGVNVLHGVDATHLSKTFGSKRFDSIIFQFPHTGSRDPIEGRNPNFILLREFLKSAKKHLSSNGKVFVTLVDIPHYHGAFQCEEAAQVTGYQSPVYYSFNPDDFSGYEHSMTNEDDSAIDDHKKFITWVFER